MDYVLNSFLQLHTSRELNAATKTLLFDLVRRELKFSSKGKRLTLKRHVLKANFFSNERLKDEIYT